jgi:uridine kinase
MSMTRAELIEMLVARIGALSLDRPIRVGIDGCDAAGKTTLGDELGRAMSASDRSRSMIRASMDDFHNPASTRHRRGKDSPEGYFLDSFDCTALIRVLLDPLGANGSRTYRRAVFDFRSDRAVDAPFETAANDAILIFDGVFLHRHELAQFWDFSIFLDIDFETAIARAERRDLDLFGSVANVRARYLQRYVPGQQLYFARCDPKRRATIVIDNTDPGRPAILRAAR